MKIGVILSICCLVVACQSRKDSDTLSTKSGIRYELLDLGDESLPIGIGQYVFLNQQILLENQLELSVNELNNQLHLLNYSCPDGALELFDQLYSGDSVHASVSLHQLLMCGIIKEIPQSNFPSDMVEWRFRISKTSAIKEKEFQPEEMSDNLRKKWQSEGDSILPYFDLIISFRETCTGEKLVQGNKVKIVHKTTRLDGSIIEYSTHKEPFEFILGQQGQVIEGMQIAISYMCKGQQVRVLIPAKYSFSKDFREQTEIYDSPIIADILVLE